MKRIITLILLVTVLIMCCSCGAPTVEGVYAENTDLSQSLNYYEFEDGVLVAWSGANKKFLQTPYEIIDDKLVVVGVTYTIKDDCLVMYDESGKNIDDILYKTKYDKIATMASEENMGDLLTEMILSFGK